VPVRISVIASQQQAEEREFVGSPTILVDGVDPFGVAGQKLRLFATQAFADLSQVLQLWLHGNRRTGRSSVGLQVHRCAGATLDMTESTCMPHPLQVVFPQRLQRAGLHMWCSSGWF